MSRTLTSNPSKSDLVVQMPYLKTTGYLFALVGGLVLLTTPGSLGQRAAPNDTTVSFSAKQDISRSFDLASVPKTNGKIAFTNTRDINTEIYVMNPDGGSQLRLTINPAFDADPAWSPDGTRIVFMSTRDANEEIYVMNADGSNQTRLTNNSALDRTPAWSPDGAQIVFASNRDSGNFDIFAMNADGQPSKPT